MDNITLHSDRLTVVISPLGAEVQSMTTPSGTELMWQADKAIWGRHAPLLFPIIGRLRNQKYKLGERTIHISQHGFGRDSLFTVVRSSETEAVFALEDSETTRAVYPFSFRLEIAYTLEGGALKKTHTVTNRSGEVMPYEVGGHDGYATTLLPGESMEDYAIFFPGQTEIHPFGMDEALALTPEKLTYSLTDGLLPMPLEVCGLDTVVLENLPVNRVTLLNRKNPIRLTVDFAEFPYLGIWTKPVPGGSNYICIEPWSTLPECSFVGPALTDKQGIRLLQPGESESLSYTVTVEE